jgi:hypothetical protein
LRIRPRIITKSTAAKSAGPVAPGSPSVASREACRSPGSPACDVASDNVHEDILDNWSWLLNDSMTTQLQGLLQAMTFSQEMVERTSIVVRDVASALGISPSCVVLFGSAAVQYGFRSSDVDCTVLVPAHDAMLATCEGGAWDRAMHASLGDLVARLAHNAMFNRFEFTLLFLFPLSFMTLAFTNACPNHCS